MTGLETLQSVQYVTAKGKHLAVLNLDDWEALIEWLETLEDVQTQFQPEPNQTPKELLLNPALDVSCSAVYCYRDTRCP